MSVRPGRWVSITLAATAFILIGLTAAVILRIFQARAAGLGDRSDTIEVGGRTRSYFVHVPPQYDGKTAVPLVLVLHGATQSAASAERVSGMSAKADMENFLVAYPTGTSRLGFAPTWNAGNCCAYAQQNNVDDVGFFRALVNKLKNDYTIDAKRVYATGISNGGMMSYRLACELSDQVAAVAPVEGAQDVTCNPASPVSVIIFHGTADRLVPFNGGTTPFQIGSRRSDTSVADTVAFWVKQDGCSATPQEGEVKEAHFYAYSGCRNGTGVALYAIQGGHHMCPGARLSHNNVPATDIMWSFFVQHPK